MKRKFQNPNLNIVIGQISFWKVFFGLLSTMFLLLCFTHICNGMVCPQKSIVEADFINDTILVHVSNSEHVYDDKVTIIIEKQATQLRIPITIHSISKSKIGKKLIFKIPNSYKGFIDKNSIIKCELTTNNCTMLDVILQSITDVF